MTNTRKFNMFILAHAIILAGILYGGVLLEKERFQEHIVTKAQQLKSVTSTLALMPSTSSLMKLREMLRSENLGDDLKETYQNASENLGKVLKVNHLDGYELSFINYDITEKKFFRVASSDAMYSFKEVLRDDSGELLKNYSMGATHMADMPGEIHKLISYSPVLDDYGMTAGIIRLSSPDLSAEMSATTAGKWAWSAALSYLLFAFIITPKNRNGSHVSRKIRKQEHLDKELKKRDLELKMLSLVAKKSENLMLITDQKGTILWVNETYENKNNYSAEELNSFTGKFLPDVSTNPHIRTILRNVVDFKKSVVYESTGIANDGKDYYAMTTVTPVKDEHGIVTKLLFVDTDITLVKRIEKESNSIKKFVELSSYPRILMNKKAEIIYHNPSALPLIENWKNEGEKMHGTLHSLLKSICESGCTHSMEYSVKNKTFMIHFHPSHEKDEMHILADEIFHVNNEKSPLDGSDCMVG